MRVRAVSIAPFLLTKTDNGAFHHRLFSISCSHRGMGQSFATMRVSRTGGIPGCESTVRSSTRWRNRARFFCGRNDRHARSAPPGPTGATPRSERGPESRGGHGRRNRGEVPPLDDCGWPGSTVFRDGRRRGGRAPRTEIPIAGIRTAGSSAGIHACRGGPGQAWHPGHP